MQDGADGAPRPWVVLGVGTSKRTRGLQEAHVRLGRAPARIVEWRDWLASPAVLDAAWRSPCRFKVEPPGDDPQVHLALLHLGCDTLGRPRCAAPDHGELLAVDAWFRGFEIVMARLAGQLASHPAVQVFNPPHDILAMTDKLACQQRLQARGTPTPPLLGEVAGYDELRALLDRHGLDRAYLKARYGSSAAGVVAFRRNRQGRQQAITSAQRIAGTGRLFNVKRLCRYDREHEIREVVDTIAAQGAYAEAWVPKPRCGRGHFDLRVLTLARRAAHRVARVGERAMTNLHLDSRRADPSDLLSAEGLVLMERTAEHAAQAFAGSQGIGFDLVVNERGESGMHAQVLEANAFGDLLPGLLWQGGDPYVAALRGDLCA